MAQVGVLGDLKYNFKAHSWVIDLGASLARLELLPDSDNRKEKPEAVRGINRVLRSHEIEYMVPNITEGEGLDTWAVRSDILEQVEDKDPALGAFLLIGAAGYFLEKAAVASGPETVAELRGLARERIDQIQRGKGDLKVKAPALFNLLAQPPHGYEAIRTKIHRASEPLVILFLFADPSNADRLRLLDEKRTLGEIVRLAIIRNPFTIVNAPGCRISDISDALQRHRPTLLHFSGHGTRNGEFCFQNAHGEVAVVKPEDFARLLSLAHKNGLNGAVMNACYSDTDAQLLADATGYAVAMEGKLSDRAANIFTREFYRALGNGETFEDAFDWAVTGARSESNTSALRPKLFKKHGAPVNG